MYIKFIESNEIKSLFIVGSTRKKENVPKERNILVYQDFQRYLYAILKTAVKSVKLGSYYFNELSFKMCNYGFRVTLTTIQNAYFPFLSFLQL
jgi:hypothetical protein